MWHFEHSVDAPVSASQVWRVWSDLANWHTWDSGVDWVRPDGPFAEGTTYTMKPSAGPEVRATMIHCERDHSFTDETRLPLCRLRFEHVVNPLDIGVRVTHRVTMSGPGTVLFRHVIGRNIARDLPGAMSRLIDRARTV